MLTALRPSCSISPNAPSGEASMPCVSGARVPENSVPEVRQSWSAGTRLKTETRFRQQSSCRDETIRWSPRGYLIYFLSPIVRFQGWVAESPAKTGRTLPKPPPQFDLPSGPDCPIAQTRNRTAYRTHAPWQEFPGRDVSVHNSDRL